MTRRSLLTILLLVSIALAADSSPVLAAQTITAAGDQHTCEADSHADLTAPLATGATVIAVGDLDARCYAASGWGDHLSRTLAVAGNHDWDDGATFTATLEHQYPTSTNRTYYVVERGAWRIYILDSNCNMKAPIRCYDQNRWLRRQLERNPSRCIAAFYHHPTWSSSQGEPHARMKRIFNILARHGAELVVSAHRHGYERFARVAGLRQIVAGTAGSTRWAPWTDIKAHSQVRIAETPGVLNLTLYWNRYSWAFIDIAGTTRDAGTTWCSR